MHSGKRGQSTPERTMLSARLLEVTAAADRGASSACSCAAAASLIWCSCCSRFASAVDSSAAADPCVASVLPPAVAALDPSSGRDEGEGTAGRSAATSSETRSGSGNMTDRDTRSAARTQGPRGTLVTHEAAGSHGTLMRTAEDVPHYQRQPRPHARSCAA